MHARTNNRISAPLCFAPQTPAAKNTSPAPAAAAKDKNTARELVCTALPKRLSRPISTPVEQINQT